MLNEIRNKTSTGLFLLVNMQESLSRSTNLVFYSKSEDVYTSQVSVVSLKASSVFKSCSRAFKHSYRSTTTLPDETFTSTAI